MHALDVHKMHWTFDFVFKEYDVTWLGLVNKFHLKGKANHPHGNPGCNFLTVFSLTRNMFVEPLTDSNRRVTDAIAASSVQANSTGVQTVTTHVMGIEELKQFLSREQEEEMEENKLLRIIQVS